MANNVEEKYFSSMPTKKLINLARDLQVLVQQYAK